MRNNNGIRAAGKSTVQIFHSTQMRAANGKRKKVSEMVPIKQFTFFFGVHFHFIDDEISSISIRNRFYILEKHFVVLNTAVPFILRLPFNASPPDDCYRGCQKQRTHRQVLRTETNSKNKNRTDTQKHTATNVAKQIAC